MKPTVKEIEESVKERLNKLDEELVQTRAEMRRSHKKYALIVAAGAAMCIAAITGVVQGTHSHSPAITDAFRVYVEHGDQVDRYLAYDVERLGDDSANLTLDGGIKIKITNADKIIVLTYDYQKVEEAK